MKLRILLPLLIAGLAHGQALGRTVRQAVGLTVGEALDLHVARALGPLDQAARARSA